MVPFEEHVLANGLKVVLAPARATPVVGVNLWYAVGSRNEPPGRTGFAHLFEHMMFPGLGPRPQERPLPPLEEVGGTANATTWFDRTNYFETVPSHHLDLALWLESDRLGWMLPAMTEEKLENQRQVVMNERRERYDNQPYGDWDERLQALLFPADHPYHHTVIGAMEDIASATLEDVHDFFSTWYRPNNAVLTICGDFEPDHAMARVQHYFGEIPSGATPPPLPGKPEIPFATGGTLRETVESAVPLRASTPPAASRRSRATRSTPEKPCRAAWGWAAPPAARSLGPHPRRQVRQLPRPAAGDGRIDLPAGRHRVPGHGGGRTWRPRWSRSWTTSGPSAPTRSPASPPAGRRALFAPSSRWRPAPTSSPCTPPCSAPPPA